MHLQMQCDQEAVEKSVEILEKNTSRANLDSMCNSLGECSSSSRFPGMPTPHSVVLD